MDNLLYLAPAAGILSLIFAGLFARTVLKQPTGTKEMREIASAIQEGAMAYLNRQYKTVAIVAIILAAAIAFLLDDGVKIATGFLAGAVASAAA
ncbi:MAG: sodium/proton-translocating pyrophosphatase, partial [Methanosarcinales archaeon]|nr:sodium/proton-translocating pyrophosphatase [Methanosarcinales archaeon]